MRKMGANRTETLTGSAINSTLYPIRAVSRLTGMSAAKLRAWEKRYGAISPGRAGRGRLYSQADIDRLLLLRAATEQGHDISQVAAMSDEQLRKLTSHPATLAESRGESAERSAEVEIDLSPVLSAIRQFDTVEADRELSRLAALLGPREMVFQVVLPLVKRIDELGKNGSLTVAHEHMASVTLRNLLGTMVRNYARAGSPTKVLFAALSGERYEFNILCGAILASGRGLKAIYLGVDLPAKEIVGAAWATGASAVVLGLTGDANTEQSMQDLRSIATGLSEGVELWVEGCRAQNIKEEFKKSPIKFLKDLKELEQYLTNLAPRS
jgi:MerR family transcriptional regulator, light-induced transcriptional regulator